MDESSHTAAASCHVVVCCVMCSVFRDFRGAVSEDDIVSASDDGSHGKSSDEKERDHHFRLHPSSSKLTHGDKLETVSSALMLFRFWRFTHHQQARVQIEPVPVLGDDCFCPTTPGLTSLEKTLAPTSLK